MCDAASIAVTSFLIQGTQAVAEYAGQKSAAKANTQSATAQLLRQYGALNARQTEEQKALSHDLQSVGSEVASATGTATTAAGEAGVSGLSTDLLVRDYSRQEATASDQLKQNYEITSDQIQREKAAARDSAISQINSVASPSFLPAALQIGAAGLQLGGRLKQRSPGIDTTTPRGTRVASRTYTPSDLQIDDLYD